MKLAPVLAAAAALAVLAGCGGSAREAVRLDSVAQAATRTAEAGSSRFELRLSMDAGGQSVSFDAAGAFDYEAKRGRMSMQMPGLGGSFELVMDGTLLFMRMPEGLPGAQPPGGKRWLKLDVEQAGAAAGADLGALLGAQQQQSPSQFLDYLKAVETEAEEVGREDVRGVSTTHYRAAIDMQKALDVQLESIPEDQRAPLRAQLEEALALTATDGAIPVDVWVDGDGVVRRMAMEVAVAGAGAMRMTMDLFDFGVDVDVDHPPAAEVLDLAELMGSAGSR